MLRPKWPSPPSDALASGAKGTRECQAPKRPAQSDHPCQAQNSISPSRSNPCQPSTWYNHWHDHRCEPRADRRPLFTRRCGSHVIQCGHHHDTRAASALLDRALQPAHGAVVASLHTTVKLMKPPPMKMRMGCSPRTAIIHHPARSSSMLAHARSNSHVAPPAYLQPQWAARRGGAHAGLPTSLPLA